MRGSRDEPLQNSIEIRFLFGTDAVAGYLAVGHALQVQGFDQLVHREMAAKIRLVTQDQEWDPLHGWLLKEDVELFFGYWQSFLIGRVDDEPGSLSAMEALPKL